MHKARRDCYLALRAARHNSDRKCAHLALQLLCNAVICDGLAQRR